MWNILLIFWTLTTYSVFSWYYWWYSIRIEEDYLLFLNESMIFMGLAFNVVTKIGSVTRWSSIVEHYHSYPSDFYGHSSVVGWSGSNTHAMKHATWFAQWVIDCRLYNKNMEAYVLHLPFMLIPGSCFR